MAESLVSRGDADPVLVQALMEPGRDLPAPTVEDARKVYVKERLGGGEAVEHRGAMVRLDRIMRRAAEAGIPATTPLTEITREDAWNLRDHMLSQVKKGTDGETVSPASVKRELNVLRAMLAYGARELSVRDFENQFARLPIEGLSSANGARVPSAREKVDPLPQSHVEGMRAKLTGDPRLIWRILTETGCRLGEVTGLRVEDVVLHGETPHLRIRWHEERRLKNASSIRSAPLMGDALDAAREAVKLAAGATHLFIRYARPRGSDAASAALMKHLRGFTADKRHKVHSLRHGMKDRMRKVGVDKGAQDVVLGHASGNIGETYGGNEGLLAVAFRALKAVEEAERPAPINPSQ